MKHLSIAVIFFLSIVGVANARPIGGSDSSFNGSQEFKHDFPQATYVTYKVRGQMTEVSFVWRLFMTNKANLWQPAAPWRSVTCRLQPNSL
jgi:hypothetical protein